MDVLRMILQGLLIVSSVFLVLLILIQKGKGGGLSDMFGGGISTSLGGSSIANRNVARLTVMMAVLWFVVIVGLGVVQRLSS